MTITATMIALMIRVLLCSAVCPRIGQTCIRDRAQGHSDILNKFRTDNDSGSDVII